MIARSIVTLLIGLTLALAPLAHATPLLTLDPAGGALAGSPGATVGWGFTFANDADYALITQAQFNTVVDIGTFTDFTVLNFYLAGAPPESAVIFQPFDLTAMSGIGSFQIYGTALPGTVAAGSIDITYDLYSRSPSDPLFDSVTDLLSVGNQLSAAASVTVTAAPVPEPATVLLLAAGLIGLGLMGKRFRQNG